MVIKPLVKLNCPLYIPVIIKLFYEAIKFNYIIKFTLIKIIKVNYNLYTIIYKKSSANLSR